MKILIAALLSAGLIQLAPSGDSLLNNSKVAAATITQQSEQVRPKATEPEKTVTPVETPAAQPEQVTTQETPAPSQEQLETSAASGSCETEIAKYNWSHSVALAVARAESGLDPGQVNNTPATGDYSVGCFQVNIYGANAYSRPSESQLKDAAVNVAFAYGIYTRNGNSFIGQWGVCRSKVACY